MADDQLDVELLVQTLRAGYDVTYQQLHTPEALAVALESQSWDVIFSDARMPGMTALDAIRLVRERGLDLPFIVVSSAIDEQHTVAAMRAGASDVLLKDNLSGLGAALERQLGQVQERRARRQAEAALRAASAAERTTQTPVETESQLVRAIFDQTIVGIAQCDLTGRFVLVNRRFCQIAGRSPDELLGLPMQAITHPQDQPASQALFAALAETGAGFVIDQRYVRPDGSCVWVRNSVSRVNGPDGQSQSAVAIVEDISQRRQAENALAERSRLADFSAQVAHILIQDLGLADILQQCAEVLVGELEAALARIWIFNPQTDMLELQASAGLYTHRDGPHSRLRLGQYKIGRIAQQRRPHLTNQVIGDPEVHDQAWAAQAGMVAFAGYPLLLGDRLAGVMAVFARHALSEAALEVMGAVAESVALGIVRKQAEAALRQQSEMLATLNQLGQVFAAELNLEKLVQAVTDTATRLVRAQFGAFFYNAVNEAGEAFTLYTLSGVPRSAFEQLPMPRNTGVFEPTFRGTGIVRSADIRQDPRYGQLPPYHGMPPGHLPVASYLAVPVVSRSGEVLGGLFFGHAEPGVFSEQDEQLVVGLAAQAAAAIDSARLYQAEHSLRVDEQRARAEAEASRQRLAFLADISSTLSATLDYDSLMQRIAYLLVPYLADYASVYILEDSQQIANVANAHASPELQQVLHELHARVELRIDSPHSLIAQVMRTGQPLLVPDFDWPKQYAGAPPAVRAYVEALNPQSAIMVPLTARARSLGVLVLALSDGHRHFSRSDLALAEEVARRAALAADNARLFQQAQRLNAELEQRVQERTAELEHSYQQLRSLSARLEATREEERLRLSREVHDQLGGAITGLKMDLAQLRRLINPADHNALAKVEAMAGQIDEVIKVVRRIATELRPGVLDDFGLLAAIEWQLQEFQARAGIRCRLLSTSDSISLDPECATAVFRVFQEALTNVARHAQATQVDVSVETSNDRLVLRIVDNGRGITPEQVQGTQSLGLAGMRERISSFAGVLDIQGTPGRGTAVVVQVPLS